MRVLDLFSGTQSVGMVCREHGWEYVGLDRDMPADIQCDIMMWDYTTYEPKHFDVITASPVCTFWSSLRACNIGRKIKGTETNYTRELIEAEIETIGKPMVDRTREIIGYLQPRAYWIENPQTSRMKDYITDLPFYDVDYCMYSDWGYRKRTRFWTDIGGFEPQLCTGECGYKIGKRHISGMADVGGGESRARRYRVPARLIEELLLCVYTLALQSYQDGA
jgi:hypothetical protein